MHSAAEVTGEQFWRSPFLALCQPKQLIEFIVLDIELTDSKDQRHVAGGGAVSSKVINP